MDRINSSTICRNSTIVRYYNSSVHADDSIMDKSDKMIHNDSSEGHIFVKALENDNYQEDRKWLFHLLWLNPWVNRIKKTAVNFRTLLILSYT